MKVFARALSLLALFALTSNAGIKLGNEVLAEKNFKPLAGKRVGLITNPSGANIGVGYPAPFHCIGLPGMDMWKTAEALNACKIPGMKFKPLTYKSYYGPFTTNIISGAQLFILDPRHAPLTALNVYLIEAAQKISGRDLFADAKKNFEEEETKKAKTAAKKAAKEKAEGKEPKKEEKLKEPVKPRTAFDMFDKVNGTDATRNALQAGVPASEIVQSWKAGEDAFRKNRPKFLLY